jgi:predicted RNA methylase
VIVQGEIGLSNMAVLTAVRAFHAYDRALTDAQIERALRIGKSRERLRDVIGLVKTYGSENLVFEPASFAEIREIIHALGLTGDDRVYDLGGGYGHFVFYGAAVTPARFTAIELVARRCDAMRRTAAALGATRVAVINADASALPMADATVLFLNSPFYPARSAQVARRLARMAAARGTRIVALNQMVAAFRNVGSLREVETGAQIPGYKFGLFVAAPGGRGSGAR